MADFNNEFWVPEIRENDLDRTFSYDINIYKDKVTPDLYKVLLTGLELSHELENENVFKDNVRINYGRKNIRVYTMTGDETIFIPIHIYEEEDFEKIKYDNQEFKEIHISIHERELDLTSNATIFYTSDNKIFLSPDSLKTLLFYRPSIVKEYIIDSISEKIVKNRSRVRK